MLNLKMNHSLLKTSLCPQEKESTCFMEICASRFSWGENIAGMHLIKKNAWRTHQDRRGCPLHS